jgi:hypothetical protein
MGERPAGTTLHRLDNELGYFKANCAWGTPVEQARNRYVNREALAKNGRKGGEKRWGGHVPPWRAAGVKKCTWFARLRAAAHTARKAAWIENAQQSGFSP